MKCSICSIKINKLYKTIHTCKCGNVYCSQHKSMHNCNFDYQREQKELLSNNLVKIECNHNLNYII